MKSPIHDMILQEDCLKFIHATHNRARHLTRIQKISFVLQEQRLFHTEQICVETDTANCLLIKENIVRVLRRCTIPIAPWIVHGVSKTPQDSQVANAYGFVRLQLGPISVRCFPHFIGYLGCVGPRECPIECVQDSLLRIRQ